jgi:hypothetical protein
VRGHFFSEKRSPAPGKNDVRGVTRIILGERRTAVLQKKNHFVKRKVCILKKITRCRFLFYYVWLRDLRNHPSRSRRSLRTGVEKLFGKAS